jgi:glycosyltransferase involved in cell wall biosynthesis
MPFFSVVIPVFNRERLVAATLDSVLHQEFADQEVIVVDDGSTDRTLDVLARYGNRIRVLQQSNQGPGPARNLGIAEARGEYVSIFDSDDIRFPWTLSTYHRAIRENGWPAFVTGRPYIFHDETELAGRTPEAFRTEVFLDYLASADEWRWFSASSFVIRRDALLASGQFPSSRISADDCDLALRLGVAPGFVHVRAPLTFGYREHAGSLKSDMGLAFRSLCYLLDQEKKGRYPGGLERAHQRIEMLTRHIRPFVVECARSGEARKAWEIYRRTWRWQARQGRWRYLLAVPALGALGLVKRRREASKA